MREKNKKQSLRTAICLMLILAMFVTILPENAQAEMVNTPGFTLDLTGLERPPLFSAIGKAGPGGALVIGTSIVLPEGEDLYILDSRQACEGKQVVRVFYEGRVWKVIGSDIVDLKDSKFNGVYFSTWYAEQMTGKKPKVKKTVIAGNVMNPEQYYFIYAKPKATAENRMGAILTGDEVKVIKEKYNSKWAQILWRDCIAYMPRKDLNSADAYLAGAGNGNQKYIKLAKKEKIAYSGILKNYDKNMTKAETCRLAVNWYQAIGHKLPKAITKSPYTDTKDSYVLMAYQLGIVKSTSNKKFHPNAKISRSDYNKILKNLVSVANASQRAYKSGEIPESSVSRENAIAAFYRAYKASQDKDYLMPGIRYSVSPADNTKVCLDVFGKERLSGAEIGLYTKNGGSNQVFLFYNVNGFSVLYNDYSSHRLTGTTGQVYQAGNGYDCQKLTIEYNDDGTVCIKNGVGMYLDIQDGVAVSGAHLKFAPKSGSSTQKFVFNVVK